MLNGRNLCPRNALTRKSYPDKVVCKEEQKEESQVSATQIFSSLITAERLTLVIEDGNIFVHLTPGVPSFVFCLAPSWGLRQAHATPGPSALAAT